jgi:hypothetical protein
MPLEVAEVALRVTRFLNPIGFENPKYMRSELSTTNTPKQMLHANRGRFHTLRTTGTKRALCGQHLVHQNQIVDHSSHDSALNAAQRKMRNSFIFFFKKRKRGDAGRLHLRYCLFSIYSLAVHTHSDSHLLL